MSTYKETVYRYRIIRHEELPEEHKNYMIANGMDPNDNWQLIWSYKDLESAEQRLEKINRTKAHFQTYKIVDNGCESVIERHMW